MPQTGTRMFLLTTVFSLRYKQRKIFLWRSFLLLPRVHWHGWHILTCEGLMHSLVIGQHEDARLFVQLKLQCWCYRGLCILQYHRTFFQSLMAIGAGVRARRRVWLLLRMWNWRHEFGLYHETCIKIVSLNGTFADPLQMTITKPLGIAATPFFYYTW